MAVFLDGPRHGSRAGCGLGVRLFGKLHSKAKYGAVGAPMMNNGQLSTSLSVHLRRGQKKGFVGMFVCVSPTGAIHALCACTFASAYTYQACLVIHRISFSHVCVPRLGLLER